MSSPLVEVKNLTKHFPLNSFLSNKTTVIHAVDGVSFSMKKGETLGLVGESGCGKSTVARLLLRLVEPSAGQVFFNGQAIYELGKKEIRRLRREMQLVFQDPFSSLNPRMKIRDIIGEPLKIHGTASGKARQEKILELMELVGLGPEQAGRYPHEFSGGQRQRIGIARALALNPRFIINDEPVSALDVSIRAQILNLMKDLQDKLGLTYLFIAHDLSIVRYMSSRVAVMYLGKIVELGPVKEIFHRPLHPYTRSLLSAVSVPDPDVKNRRFIMHGEMPSPTRPPTGCRFRTRCPFFEERCSKEEPEPRELGKEHRVCCHLAE